METDLFLADQGVINMRCSISMRKLCLVSVQSIRMHVLMETQLILLIPKEIFQMEVLAVPNKITLMGI
jgi:hypothetical protein